MIQNYTKFVVTSLCLLFTFNSLAQEIGTIHMVNIQRMVVEMEGFKVSYRTEVHFEHRLVDVMLLEHEEAGTPRLHMISYDIGTGIPVANDEHMWTKDRKIEKAIGSGNDLLIISYSFDEQEKRLGLFCQGYDPITLDELFPSTDLGRITLTDYREGYKLGLKFTRSPDGSKQLILFDRIRTKEDDQQLVFCWVLDKTDRNTWSAVHPMDVEAAKYATTGYVVNNAGIVHLCSREKIRGGRYKGHSYTVYRLFGEERKALELSIPEGKKINIMTILQNGDRIVAIGFLAEVRSATHEYFTADLGSDDDLHIQLRNGPIQDIPGPIDYMTTAMGDDGLVFLSGTDRESFILTCAIDIEGGSLYSTLIPRKKLLYNYGPPHYTLTDGKVGMLLMPDNDANLDAYRTGGKLNHNKDDGNHVVLVTFDGSGMPAYQRLPLDGIDMLYTSFERTKGGRTVIFTGNKRSGNNELVAVKIFWHLDNN